MPPRCEASRTALSNHFVLWPSPLRVRIVDTLGQPGPRPQKEARSQCSGYSLQPATAKSRQSSLASYTSEFKPNGSTSFSGWLQDLLRRSTRPTLNPDPPARSVQREASAGVGTASPRPIPEPRRLLDPPSTYFARRLVDILPWPVWQGARPSIMQVIPGGR